MTRKIPGFKRRGPSNEIYKRIGKNWTIVVTTPANPDHPDDLDMHIGNKEARTKGILVGWQVTMPPEEVKTLYDGIKTVSNLKEVMHPVTGSVKMSASEYEAMFGVKMSKTELWILQQRQEKLERREQKEKEKRRLSGKSGTYWNPKTSKYYHA